MLLSPVQLASWHNARDMKAVVKAVVSFTIFLLIFVNTGPESGIPAKLLAANCLVDCCCFVAYVLLRQRGVKKLW